jgi:hypothetical protein
VPFLPTLAHDPRLLCLAAGMPLPLGDHCLYAHRYVFPVCNRGPRAAPSQKVQPLIAAGLNVTYDRLGQHLASSVVDLVIGHSLSGSRVLGALGCT